MADGQGEQRRQEANQYIFSEANQTNNGDGVSVLPFSEELLPVAPEIVVHETGTGPSLILKEKQKKQKEKKAILPRLGVKRKTVFNETEKALYEEAKRLQHRVARLNREKADLKKDIQSALALTKKRRFQKVTEHLTPVQQRFFASQLRNVSRTPKGRSFTFEDKADAIAIWKNSPKTYKLLSKMFALPSVSTLKSTLNKVPLNPGISKPIFEVLKRQIARMRHPNHRMCILTFDEIAIQPHLDYSPHEDKVIGFEDDGFTRTRNVADHVCVFMLRGIFKRWKQPVAFAFCKSSMQPHNIARFYKEIVKEATETGLNVIASVCDQGATNRKAIDQLLEETKREAILKGQEVTDGVVIVGNHQVIPIYDPPHLLKSLRNNLLTKDLVFVQNNKRRVAKWSHIVDAFHLDHARSIRSIRKLSKHHISPMGNRKMKVSLCSQVFSATVASFIDLVAGATLERCEGRSLPSEAQDTSVLIKFLDTLFDSVNGGFGHASGKVLRGMVSRRSPHLKVWIEDKRVLSTMEFVKSKPGDRTRPPVLDGWYRTLTGFILIRQTLQRLGCNSFPARAFNQDPLENFFGQVRQYGIRYTNPTCKMFVPFYKALLIRNFSSYHSSGSNCEQDDNALLVTIRDYLSQKDAAPEEEPDRWQPPPVVDTDTDVLDSNALGYVSGFILKYISPEKYDCEVCLQNLQHVGEPDQLYHQLVRLREYNETEKRRLKYTNVNVIKVLCKLLNYLNILVPSALYHLQFSRRLISHLRILIDFRFEECPHADTVQTQLLSMFVKMYIFAYMKRLGNIVFGKEDPQAGNELELVLYKLSTRFQRK